MKKNITLELHEVINQLSLPYLAQLLSFSRKLLGKQNRDFKK